MCIFCALIIASLFLQLVYIVYSLRSDLSEEHTSTDDQHLRSFDDIFFFAKLLTLRSELDWGLHYSMASFLCGNGAKQLSDVSRQLAAHPAGGKTQLTEPNFCTDISWNITMYTVDYCVNILEGLLQNSSTYGAPFCVIIYRSYNPLIIVRFSVLPCRCSWGVMLFSNLICTSESVFIYFIDCCMEWTVVDAV